LSLQDNAVVTTGSLTSQMSTIGGFIKIEMQGKDKVWRDVTLEILNHGFADRSLTFDVNGDGDPDGRPCNDPTPNAIIRLQRFRDNNETPTNPFTECSYRNVMSPTNFVPNTLFDTREAIYRDANPNTPGSVRLGGVMHYVTLDVANLSLWFQKLGPYAADSGSDALTDGEDGGYSVYFSDRRNNRNQTNQETGEYGFEDVVNPASATGVPNGTLDAGENMNVRKGVAGTLETYGQFPSFQGTYNQAPDGATGVLTQTQARPTRDIRAPYAQNNRAVLFRRALKLVRGGSGQIVRPGLTIAAENPVYIQGDWNATTQPSNADPFTVPHVATSVVGDAVTLLSNGWNDNRSFTSPYSTAGRPRTNTSYRLAIIAGKGPIFPQPTNMSNSTFGTDGGVHSFLRFLEGVGTGWVNYRGSMATLYYNRQAISPFKCCAAVIYDTPRRRYEFDLDFLDPALLPPLTPMFRDLNALGFTQETRPGK
jgi:hypothetical protein